MFNKSLIKLFLLLSCIINIQLQTLERDYHTMRYCIEHEKEAYFYPYFKDNPNSDLSRCLRLIPPQQGKYSKCNHIYCPTCKISPTYRSNKCSQNFLGKKWDCCCSEYPNEFPPFTYGVSPLVSFPMQIGLQTINNQEGWHTNWQDCQQHSIYPGYLQALDDFWTFYQFYLYLVHYVATYPNCHCFWPETSELAANINNKAHLLFENLLEDRALMYLIYDSEEKKKFFLTYSCSEDISFDEVYAAFNHDELDEKIIVARLLVRHCFFYSHYIDICQRLQNYSKETFNDTAHQIINQKLYKILNELKIGFQNLYTKYLQQHPNQFIKREKFLVDHWKKFIE